MFFIFVLFLSFFGFLFVSLSLHAPPSQLILTSLDLVWFLTDKPKTFSGRQQPLMVVVVVVGGDGDGDGGGGGIKPFQPLARAAFKLCGLNSQHFEFQMDMRRLGRELCLSLLHTCTHTHPLRGGGGRGGNGGGWLPREMKGRLSQKKQTNSVGVAALCHGPQVAPLSLLAYTGSEVGRGAFSGGTGSR